MKKSIISVAIVIATICMSSCNGKTAKTAGKYAKEAYKEYRKINESEGIKYLKMTNRTQQIQNIINNYNVCESCGGYGFVYQLDAYGYYVIDMYGNPQIVQCPNCGGTGRAY